ncbi:MAG: single-stranded DNA-binding protein [Chitinophagales bacterium]
MKLTLTAIGYLGHSCTVRDVQGKKAITFSLACTKKYKDKAGVQQQKTTWLECTLWKEPHELKIAEYLKKGTQVCVTGQPEARGYISNKDTSKVIGSLMVRVSELILLGKQNRSLKPTRQLPQQLNLMFTWRKKMIYHFNF